MLQNSPDQKLITVGDVWHNDEDGDHFEVNVTLLSVTPNYQHKYLVMSHIFQGGKPYDISIEYKTWNYITRYAERLPQRAGLSDILFGLHRYHSGEFNRFE